MNEVKKTFYDPKYGLKNLDQFLKTLDDLNIRIARKKVEEFYDNQEVNQIMKPVTKKRIYNSKVANYPRDIYEMDIIIYDRYEMNHYKYILVIIDIYSRYLSCRPMTNRRMETIIEKFEDIMKEMKEPQEIHCDNEFNKNEFNDLLKKKKIEVRYSDPNEINKNPIVERVNRTIAQRLQKIRLTTKKYDWYNYLNDVVFNYNNSYHRTVKNKPIDILHDKKSNMQKITNIPTSYKIGDKVRLVIKKKVFSKGDEIKYSKDVYIIKEIKGKKYLLSNDKYYKEYEIKKINEIEYNEEPAIIPETKTQEKKIKNQLKRDDIDVNKIITSKRERKPINYKE